jgi:type IV pilus assembly protein PilE
VIRNTTPLPAGAENRYGAGEAKRVKALKNVFEGNAMKKCAANGFTLMEMMITVAIIGILAAIGYPSYIKYVTETRRSDATINLTRIASLQEKFFTECGRYADTLGVSGTPRNCAGGVMDAGLMAGGLTRDGGNYILTAVVAPGPAPLNAAGGGGFTLTATPAGLQAVRDAVRCTTLTINNIGVKTATGTEGDPINGGRCWKK